MKAWLHSIVKGPIPAAVVLGFLFMHIGIRFAPADGPRGGESVFYDTQGALSIDEGERIAPCGGCCCERRTAERGGGDRWSRS